MGWQKRGAASLFSSALGAPKRGLAIIVLLFLAVLATAYPLPAKAQPTGKRATIGFLGATSPAIWATFIVPFQQRFHELGWTEGGNVAIEYRWAEGRDDRYAQFAAEFVRRKVDVIVTSGTAPVLAAMRATSEIPIVFAAAGDPVGTKLVASLARPGRNVTGLSNQQTDLAGKRVELLHEITPNVRRLAVIGNVETPNAVLEMKELERRQSDLRIDVVMVSIHKKDDIIPALESIRGQVDAVYICTDPLLTMHRSLITNFALNEKLPTMYAFREYVVEGGLMSYGANFPDLFRRSAEHVDKILRGAKPDDIPVEQPRKFDLIINLKTAKLLGVNMPRLTLARATELIE